MAVEARSQPTARGRRPVQRRRLAGDPRPHLRPHRPIAEGGREYRATGSDERHPDPGHRPIRRRQGARRRGRTHHRADTCSSPPARARWSHRSPGWSRPASTHRTRSCVSTHSPTGWASSAAATSRSRWATCSPGFGSNVTLFNRSRACCRAQDEEIAARFTEVFGGRVDLRLGHLPTQDRAARRLDRDPRRRRGDRGRRAARRDRAVSPTATCSTPRRGGLDVPPPRHDRRRRVHAHRGRRGLGDRRRRQRVPAQARRQPRGDGRVLEHRPPRRIRSAVDHTAVPAAVFSNPQVASRRADRAAASRDRRPQLRRRPPRLRRHGLRLGARRRDIVRQGARRRRDRADHRRPHHRTRRPRR